MSKPKILIGRDAIAAFLHKLDGAPISKPTLSKFIGLGLPCTVIDRVYYAHADNVEEFFKKLTFRRVKDQPPEAE